jgi:hypothetical protein
MFLIGVKLGSRHVQDEPVLTFEGAEACGKASPVPCRHGTGARWCWRPFWSYRNGDHTPERQWREHRPALGIKDAGRAFEHCCQTFEVVRGLLRDYAGRRNRSDKRCRPFPPVL